MKNLNWLRQGFPVTMAALLLVLGVTSCSKAKKDPLKAAGDSILITGISLVLAEENRATSPKDILISDGKIAGIKDAGLLPHSLAKNIISGEGLFVMPGIIDVHAHIGDGGINAQSPSDRQNALTQFVRYGVTSIFVPGGGAGNDHNMAEWKARCKTSELRCPDLFGSGALITVPGSHPISTIWNFPEDISEKILYARGATVVKEDTNVDSLIESKVALGADAIKIIIEDWGGTVPRLPNHQIEQLTSASHRHGLKVLAHVSMPAHIENGLAHGIDAVMHSVEGPLGQLTLESMAQQRVFFVSTLSLYDGFINRALGKKTTDVFALAGVSETALASLEDFNFSPFDTREQALSVQATIFDNLRRAAEAGVPLALGTDVNNPAVYPGYSSHREMELMVQAGLSPAVVLEAATHGGAIFLAKHTELGRIQPGYEADLLLLKQNPLEDIRHTRGIHTVIADGRLVENVVTVP
ncbi:MAG: amidohydrolase family protein [Bacteroidota bacterium]